MILMTVFLWVANILFLFQQDPILEQSKQRGAVIYEEFCVTCHRPSGKGFGKNYPPLAGSDFLLNKRTESIRAVKFGLTGEILVNGKTYNKTMEPLGLTNEEVTDVMNYILNSWGNSSDKIVTLSEVSAIEK